jgi:hypothetical protein
MINDNKINRLTEKIALQETYDIVVNYLFNRFATPRSLIEFDRKIPPKLYNQFKTTFYKVPGGFDIGISDKNKFATYLFVMSCLLRTVELRYIINNQVYTWSELLETFANFFDHDVLFQYVELQLDNEFQQIIEDKIRKRLYWNNPYDYFDFTCTYDDNIKSSF